MQNWHWALLLKPFVMLFIGVVFIAPLKWLFIRYFPAGRVKRVLLIRW